MNEKPANLYWQAVACDLDGTLIGRDHRVKDRDLDAMRDARAAGIHVAICTGRNAMESAGVIGALQLDGPGVFVNGAMVCDMATGRSLTCRYVDYELALETIEFFGSRGHAVLVLTDHPQTGQPTYFHTNHGPPHRATVEWLLVNRMRSEEVPSVPAAFRSHVIRMGIVVDVGEHAAVTREIDERFGGRLSHHSIYSPYFDCQVIETFRAATSKWSGIVEMCALQGLESERVIAVGDDVNDVAMLQSATLSFAMGNAKQEVRAQAKRVTGTQPECGVAQVIEALLRGELNP